MRRTKKTFLAGIKQKVPLAGKRIIEIGCGSGNYTKQLVQACSFVMAIDSDPQAIKLAHDQVTNSNVRFQVMSAENLSEINETFDIAIFTLSLHHVPIPLMVKAINESIQVVDSDGYIIFLEPTEAGSFFTVELNFNACDGDEREEKKAAYEAMKHHPNLIAVAELNDQTEFHWDSIEDFMHSMNPTKNIEHLEKFLEDNEFTLTAQRRINIFQIRQ